MLSLFPYSPVIRECSWKKTQIEKKENNCSYVTYILDCNGTRIPNNLVCKQTLGYLAKLTIMYLFLMYCLLNFVFRFYLG